MAPILPLGKKGVLALLRPENLPFRFGWPHAMIGVLEQDGKFRVRELVVDRAEADAVSKQTIASIGIWTPEHHFALGKPTGEVFIEADSIAELAAKIEAYPWPKDW